MQEQPTCEAFTNTLLYSWGGDTPPEAIWALQSFVSMINAKFGLTLVAPTEEEYYSDNEAIVDSFQVKVDLINEAVDAIGSNNV